LKSPTVRANKPAAKAYDKPANQRVGSGFGMRPAVAATNAANISSTVPTATVDPADGTNTGLPATLGTAPPAPDDRPPMAMWKCHRARATNVALTPPPSQALKSGLMLQSAGAACRQFEPCLR
jgi:hypothetical protein